jgi:hypothetical protein
LNPTGWRYQRNDVTDVTDVTGTSIFFVFLRVIAKAGEAKKYDYLNRVQHCINLFFSMQQGLWNVLETMLDYD